MAKIKKLKIKQSNNTYSDYIYLGADAVNIDLADGTTAEDAIVELQQDLEKNQENITILEEKFSAIDLSPYAKTVDIENIFEKIENKVTTISETSTDEQYPSAKCIYDIIGTLENTLTELNSGGGI